MNLEFYLDRLEHTPAVICSLVDGVSSEQARWKPAADQWSILEVVNHLADEEQQDFRARLDKILHHPGQPFAPIDPPRWAIERKYNEQELTESLGRFLDERQKSLQWLRSLLGPNWEHTHQLPHGPIQAGDILASWAAHDLLHVRQLAKLHWEFLNRESAPFKTEYAGRW
ncbi:MAG: DinB family protein [Pirellulaceae bacterium]|nr:DinB family protein [Pirellulaceae bacterium]